MKDQKDPKMTRIFDMLVEIADFQCENFQEYIMWKTQNHQTFNAANMT